MTPTSHYQYVQPLSRLAVECLLCLFLLLETSLSLEVPPFLSCLANDKTEIPKQNRNEKVHKNTMEFILYWLTPPGLGHVLEGVNTLSEIPLDKADFV